MAELYHLTERANWQKALRAGEYRMSTRGVTLAEQGFIHCSLAHQLRGVAEMFYQDADDLVVLVIDSARVPAPVRYEAAAPVRGEAPPPGQEGFPHIYGPLPVDAVTRVVAVGRDGAGEFVLPGSDSSATRKPTGR
jgi:uncharacterized protein (DUF952 family)